MVRTLYLSYFVLCDYKAWWLINLVEVLVLINSAKNSRCNSSLEGKILAKKRIKGCLIENLAFEMRLK